MNDNVLQEQQVGNGLLITGYVFAFLGGVIGAVIGWNIWRGKRVVDGEKKFAYEVNSRNHGRIIFWLSIILMFIGIVVNTIAAS